MPLPATLVVLAGGLGRRMGRPKALLPVAGITLVEWVCRRLGPAFAEVLVAVQSDDQVPPALRPQAVHDLHRGAGPLAGIEAGLAAAGHETVLTVACDLPHVTPDLARRLVTAAADADAAVPRVGGRPQPTCAAYRRSAAGPIAAALGAGQRRASDALAELDVRWLDDVDAELLANLNTPADYEAFLRAVDSSS